MWKEQEHPRDAKGRFTTKWGRALGLGNSLSSIRRKYNKDLKLPGMPRDKATALIVALLDKVKFRMGNEESMDSNDTYGITTIQKKHVSVQKNAIVFRFPGKRGVQQVKRISDPTLVSGIKEMLSLEGGKRSGGSVDADDLLFKYVNTQKQVRTVSPYVVNSYLDKWGITAKDFRTYHASRIVFEYLNKNMSGDVETNIQKAVEKAAKELGHEPRTALRSYVDPNIIKKYREMNKSFSETDDWLWEEYADVFSKYHGNFFDLSDIPEFIKKSKNDDNFLMGARNKLRNKIKNKMQYDPDGKPYSNEALGYVRAVMERFQIDPNVWAESAMVRAAALGKFLGTMDASSKPQARILFESLPVRLEQATKKTFTIKDADGVVHNVMGLQGQEQEALQYAINRAGEYVASTDQKLLSGIKQLVIQAKQERWSAQELASKLFDRFGEHNRDWRRIAVTELGYAGNNGYLGTLSEGDTLMIQEAADMCPHCERLNVGRVFTFRESGRDADVDKDIWIGKNNVGRKTKDWVACAPLHPNCRGRYIKMNTTFYKLVDGKPTLKTVDEILEEKGVRKNV